MTTQRGERLRRKQFHYRMMGFLEAQEDVPASTWLWRAFFVVLVTCGVILFWDLRAIVWGLLALILLQLMILGETLRVLIDRWRDET
jgi:hypothetical protein